MSTATHTPFLPLPIVAVQREADGSCYVKCGTPESPQHTFEVGQSVLKAQQIAWALAAAPGMKAALEDSTDLLSIVIHGLRAKRDFSAMELSVIDCRITMNRETINAATNPKTT